MRAEMLAGIAGPGEHMGGQTAVAPGELQQQRALQGWMLPVEYLHQGVDPPLRKRAAR